MQKIWLIGGSGFIGTEVINKISNSNFVNLDIKKPHKPINWIKCDINNDLKRLFKPKKSDTVWIFAAEHKDDVKPIKKYYQTNVEALKKIVEIIKNADVKKVLFLSSVAVYGSSNLKMNETHQKKPYNHYGKSKLLAENILFNWAKTGTHNNLIIIRPTAVFGPANRGNIFRLFKACVSEYFILPGSGKEKKSIAYVKNLSDFILFISKSDKLGINIFNYADQPNLSVTEIINLCREIKGIKKNYLKIPQQIISIIILLSSKFKLKKIPLIGIFTERLEKINSPSNVCSLKAFETGFNQKFTIKDGIKKTLDSI